MAQVNTDRRFGVNAGAAIKVPVKAATTADVTLSGEQTIDGIACVTGDRVLVQAQTDGTENGIYQVDTSNWQRTPDWDGAYDVVEGSLVKVNQGATNTGFWYVSTTGIITIGTTSVVIARASSVLAQVSAFVQTLLDDLSAAAFLVSLGITASVAELNASDDSVSVRLHDHFLGDEIDGYKWQSLMGTDANGSQAVVFADQAGGVARLTTGADAGGTMALNGVTLFSALNWKAENGSLVFEARLKVDAITNVAIFVGLTDQKSALEMPFTLGAGDALTSNATDAVGVLFDTGADTDGWWLVGVNTDVDAAKEDSGVAPVADTYETWRVELSAAGEATFYRNGAAVGSAMANAVAPAAALTPVVAAFSLGAASRNVDVDYIFTSMVA